MTRAALLGVTALCLGCNGGGGKTQPPEEPPPWIFPGEDVDPDRWPEGVKVEMGMPSIDGPLGEDTVRGVLRPQVEDLEKCYAARLAWHCKIAGYMRIEIGVSQKGRISDLRVLSDTTRDTRLGDCVTKVVR